MHKNLLRPGLESIERVSGLDMLTMAGMDGHEPGWARPYATDATSPYWYASGDDDEDEEEEDDEEGKKDEEEDEDEEDDDEDKGKTPEELAAEVKRLRAAYLKKLRNSKNRGTRIKELETGKTKAESDLALLQEQLDELKKTAGKEVDSEAATKRINELVEKAKEEGKNAFKPVVIRMAARAELMAAGARPNLVDRLVKMVDVDDVDIDDEDGSIDVSDQVEALKKDMPEMFGPRKAVTARRKKTTTEAGASTKKAGGSKGGEETDDSKPKRTAAEVVANRLRGIRD
jgi:hypothetical protein